MARYSRDSIKRRRFGALDSIVVQGDPEAPTIVFLHGFGADMTDLAPLADVIQAPKNCNWIFPNGHLTVDLGGHMEGRAWFPISVAALERSMSLGESIDLSAIVPPGLKKARGHLLQLIETLNVPMNKLVLGGFSQGAMLALDTTLQLETPPAGLVLLSGTLVNAQEWQTLAPRHQGLEFYQSHGFRDSVLSFAMAERLADLLRKAGWKGEVQRFEGAHEIPPEVLIRVGAYLRKCLA